MHHVIRIILALAMFLQPLAVAAQITIEQDSVLSPLMPGMQSDGDESKGSLGGSVPPVVEGIIGGALVIGGIVLMISGFKNIDVSRPELDISNWTWTKQQAITWWVDARGTVRNTGNVPLRNIRIIQSYYDSSGQLISQEWNFLDVYWLNPLPVNAQDSWSWPPGGWTTEPMRASIRAEYTYDKIYERKNPVLGWFGVASAGFGAYLLYDALYRGSKLHAALGRRGIDFVLASNIPEGYGGVEVRYGF